jgi:hypothetical protein
VEFRAKADCKTVLVNAGESVAASATGLSKKSSFDPAAMDAELSALASAVSSTPSNIASDQVRSDKAKLGSGGKWMRFSVSAVFLLALAAGALVLKRKKSK